MTSSFAGAMTLGSAALFLATGLATEAFGQRAPTELVEIPLEKNIDRIEVIRGPGASLWGANAVNGVINVVTKWARDTRGGLLSLGAGNEERGFGTLRGRVTSRSGPT